jgi:hypothetical protein
LTDLIGKEALVCVLSNVLRRSSQTNVATVSRMLLLTSRNGGSISPRKQEWRPDKQPSWHAPKRIKQLC